MNDTFPMALPIGSVLAGQYIIEKVLGQGGFGITYQASDHKSGNKVAIKEFFPDSLVIRTERSTVTPYTGERAENFNYGKDCFLQEAETLSQFIGNENIVRIYSYFEENGTAYFVMDFIEGISFDEYIRQQGGKISMEDTKRILLPVMDALAVVHSRGIVHRDVTPDNIYITNSGVVKLLDFGAARYSLGDKSRSLDVVLKHGFAPKEQYARHGRQGPFTDVYAMGATFYFALTGKRPPDSVERMDEDYLIPPTALGVKISAQEEDAILKALSMRGEERFQNMTDFKHAIEGVSGNEGVDPAAVPPLTASQGVTQIFFDAPSQITPSQQIGRTTGQVYPSTSPASQTGQVPPVQPAINMPEQIPPSQQVGRTTGQIYPSQQVGNSTGQIYPSEQIGRTTGMISPSQQSGSNDRASDMSQPGKKKTGIMAGVLVAVGAVAVIGIAIIIGAIIIAVGVGSSKASSDSKYSSTTVAPAVEDTDEVESITDNGSDATEKDSAVVETTAADSGDKSSTQTYAPADFDASIPPSTAGWNSDMKIYAYSWNEEFGSRLDMILEEYPEYKNYVEFINLGISATDGSYEDAIANAMRSDSRYPSLIAADNDIVKKYTESDDVLPMDSVGITKELYSNAYKCTIDFATYKGALKAVTWQVTPGCFIYRTDIANEVLGTSDPAEVQEYVKDWDTFFETAGLMQSAGYSMLAGPDEIKHAVLDQKTSPWVTESADGSLEINLDSSVSDYLELSKALYDGGYTNFATQWSTDWSAGYEGNVFGYFGCTWSVYWCINTDPDSPTSTYGKWHICQGPVSYHWGGTYICVGKDTPNPELCGFLLYELCCDTDMMYAISADTLDFVNNREAMARISDNGKGVSPILGGQDAVAIWLDSAEHINLSNSTAYDAEIMNVIDEASYKYNNWVFTNKNEAIRWIKDTALN